MSKIIDRYTTAFGKEYGITFIGIVPSKGDYKAGQFTVNTEAGQLSTVLVKISGTIISIWGLNDSQVEQCLPWLGIAKIKIALETEELKQGNDELSYDSYNSASSYDEEGERLKKEIGQLITNHEHWIELEKQNYINTGELGNNIGRDHAVFQRDNAKEIRTTLLQIASISAAIIAGVIALGDESLKSNLLLLLALLLLGIVIGLSFYRIFSILEGQAISTFNWFKEISAQIDRERKAEADFLLNPSVEKYESLTKLREKEGEATVKRMQEDEITEIKKDIYLKWAQILFAVAILLLIFSFMDRAKILNSLNSYSQKIQFYLSTKPKVKDSPQLVVSPAVPSL